MNTATVNPPRTRRRDPDQVPGGQATAPTWHQLELKLRNTPGHLTIELTAETADPAIVGPLNARMVELFDAEVAPQLAQSARDYMAERLPAAEYTRLKEKRDALARQLEAAETRAHVHGARGKSLIRDDDPLVKPPEGTSAADAAAAEWAIEAEALAAAKRLREMLAEADKDLAGRSGAVRTGQELAVLERFHAICDAARKKIEAAALRALETILEDDPAAAALAYDLGHRYQTQIVERFLTVPKADRIPEQSAPQKGIPWLNRS